MKTLESEKDNPWQPVKWHINRIDWNKITLSNMYFPTWIVMVSQIKWCTSYFNHYSVLRSNEHIWSTNDRMSSKTHKEKHALWKWKATVVTCTGYSIWSSSWLCCTTNKIRPAILNRPRSTQIQLENLLLTGRRNSAARRRIFQRLRPQFTTKSGKRTQQIPHHTIKPIIKIQFFDNFPALGYNPNIHLHLHHLSKHILIIPK